MHALLDRSHGRPALARRLVGVEVEGACAQRHVEGSARVDRTGVVDGSSIGGRRRGGRAGRRRGGSLLARVALALLRVRVRGRVRVRIRVRFRVRVRVTLPWSYTPLMYCVSESSAAC